MSCDNLFWNIESLFRHLRRIFPFTKIYVVMGNHDFWMKQWNKEKKTGRRSINDIHLYHEQICDAYQVTYLHNDFDRFWDKGQAVWFAGYDGWYSTNHGESNDYQMMARQIDGLHPWYHFYRRSQTRVQECLDFADEITDSVPVKKVCLTHFSYPVFENCWESMCAPKSWINFITEKYDYFFFGHSHIPYEGKMNNCTVINVGCGKRNHGYDNPLYRIIEI
jgi:predicted phosphodiesterase